LEAAAAVLVIAGVAPYDADDLEWTAGMGQENVTEFGAALQGEEQLRRLLVDWRDHLKDPTVEMIVSSLETLLPDVDRAVLTDEFGEDMVANFREALSNGVDGWVDDDLAFTRSWGFDLKEISVPTAIWQGSVDLMVPFAHGQWFSEKLPAQRSTFNRERGICRSGWAHSVRCWTSSSAPASSNGARPPFSYARFRGLRNLFTGLARAPSVWTASPQMPARLR
jgi:pimeloyl-ACP methyl ester carboxylesterase